MRARVIQMINNFYKDGENKRIMSGESSNTPLGEYCCLGHFDALHIELVKWDESGVEQSIRGKINETIAEKFNGRYNIRNVVCITNDDTKDDKFWKKAKALPYLFVSLVRIKHTDDQLSEKLSELITQFNKSDQVMAYCTYDHSEIVVIRIAKSYIEGFKAMLFMYNKLNILKMYSVFAVREDELEKCDNVCEEIIDCRLNATIKDRSKVDEYEVELRRFLQKEGVPKEFGINLYQTLGNSDCLIEITQVPIKQMLRCYKMGELLTHTNKSYNDAFFNVESQFLFMEKRENGTMDNE